VHSTEIFDSFNIAGAPSARGLRVTRAVTSDNVKCIISAWSHAEKVETPMGSAYVGAWADQ
jgi:hypothetical protein